MGVAKQHVKQQRACIELYISEDKRRIGSCGEPDVTEVHRDRRHTNLKEGLLGIQAKRIWA